MIAAVTFAHVVLRLNPILAFWLAYILTRPLGASIGDEMSQNSHKYGGLGLGTTGTSSIFLGCILALVTYLSVTKRDQTPPEVVAQDLQAHPDHHPHHHRRQTPAGARAPGGLSRRGRAAPLEAEDLQQAPLVLALDPRDDLEVLLQRRAAELRAEALVDLVDPGAVVHRDLDAHGLVLARR